MLSRNSHGPSYNPCVAWDDVAWFHFGTDLLGVRSKGPLCPLARIGERLSRMGASLSQLATLSACGLLIHCGQ